MSLLTIFIATLSLVVFIILVREIFRHITVKRRCPICSNEHPDRAKRLVWAKSMQVMVASQGYQCHACGNRYIRIGRSTSKEVAT